VSERTLVNLIYRSTAFHALTTTSTLIRTPLLLAINKFGAALARIARLIASELIEKVTRIVGCN